MKIYYRISDGGYSKVKLESVNNESCLKNFCKVFEKHLSDIIIIADNVSDKTYSMIQQYTTNVVRTNIGHGAGSFNYALDLALKLSDEDIVYFVEDDYIHKPHSDTILEEGIGLGASFVSLYDHPDKYMDPNQGGNPYCENGAEDTRVYLTKSTHWKLTNSTTMTFASKVSTLKSNEYILRKWTNTNHPHDFEMWLELREKSQTLVTPIPGYSTHGESAWLTPLTNWNDVNSNS